MTAHAPITLGKNTLAYLKVAAAINPSFLGKPGNDLKVISPSGHIFMHARIEETLPVEFALFELQRFLSVVGASAMAGATLNFDDSANYVMIKTDRSSTKYHFTDSSFITYADKDIKINPADINFIGQLSENQLIEIRKMAAVLNHTHMSFVVTAGAISVRVSNPEVSDVSNDFVMELGANDSNYAEGTYSFKLVNLMLVDGNYKITVFRNAVSKWEHDSGKVDIFIGTEKI